MAIGDNTNPNLFGTNYNPEDEEEKKALLAAQNAMMGAGNIPASAFGQAPAVAPFSLEAAGQVNPMMEQQSLEVTPQPQVTFRDYEVPATPRASALSVFTPGGDVKPNVDVNAITPSPEMTSTSAVNTALNQEVPVDTVNKPGPVDFFFGAPTPEQARKILETQPTSPSQRENLQAIVGGEERPSSVSKGFDYLFGRPDVPGDSNILQTPSAIIDPFTGKTIEKPTPFAYDSDPLEGMTANQQAVMNAIAKTNAQRQEAAQGQASTAPTNGLTTVGGASLSEFLSGQAMPEQGFTEAEPLSGRGVTLTPDQMNELSAQREARLDARPDFGEAVSDRDRRAARGDGISMADQTAMAKANARGATPSEVARGNQVANALGVDLETGQPLQATSGLSEPELQRRREFAYKQEQDILAAETKAKETEGERSVNRAKAVGSLQALKADLDLIKETGEEVRTLTLKPRTEGLLAKALATVSPTSTAAQLERASGVLTGDAFIKGMQVIKAFGGGLGSVTEVEGLKVERAQGAIFENGMGDEERRQAVKDYIQVRENAYNRIREAFVKEYGETDAQTYLGTQNANATAGKAVPNDRNVASAADTLLSDPKYN